MEIDLVYLWVNGNDPKWQAKYRAVTGGVVRNSSVDCKGRYADNDELKYSLRSVELYAPWIRKIFIVTDNQVPEWLDTSNPKIQIVDHTEILPPESLPCFNSTLLEHFLYRIPGLSEHFIYGNDDMLLNRAATPDTFFGTDGFPIVRMHRKHFRKLSLWFRQNILRKNVSVHVKKVENAARLVESKYGVYFSCRTHHNIDAYCRSDYELTHKTFADAIKPSYTHHLRNEEDIERQIYSYVPLIQKRAHVQYVDKETSFRIQIHRTEQYEKMSEANPIFFCMNDSEFANDDDRVKSREFLEKRFPEKSKFEK